VRRQIYVHGNDGARDRLLLDWADRIDRAAGESALAVIESWPRPRFPLKGADLVKLGLPEGPRVGEILDKAEAWWIERDFAPDRAACLVFARNLV
jgi:poly(A) polymerase